VFCVCVQGRVLLFVPVFSALPPGQVVLTTIAGTDLPTPRRAARVAALRALPPCVACSLGMLLWYLRDDLPRLHRMALCVWPRCLPNTLRVARSLGVSVARLP
jgi:hypothetical protein